MQLLQPRFPNSTGGRNISFLKIITNGEDSLVFEVTNHLRKEGKGIAECKVEEKFFDGNYIFTTCPQDAGHKELCKLLCKRGVRGIYLTWRVAIENDNKSLAEAEERNSIICFPCISLGEEEASKWKIDCS